MHQEILQESQQRFPDRPRFIPRSRLSRLGVFRTGYDVRKSNRPATVISMGRRNGDSPIRKPVGPEEKTSGFIRRVSALIAATHDSDFCQAGKPDLRNLVRLESLTYMGFRQAGKPDLRRRRFYVEDASIAKRRARDSNPQPHKGAVDFESLRRPESTAF